MTPVAAATPVVTTTAVPVQPAAAALLQTVVQQHQQQQQQQQQQSAAIAQQQAEVRAKIEEEAQRKMLEGSISNEENMSISGSNARYMVMQKLSRKSEVSVFFLECNTFYICCTCNSWTASCIHKGD